MSSKVRLDALLVSKYPNKTRSYLQNYIKEGLVLVNDKVISKPGLLVMDDSDITINDQSSYVSRGAYKLEAAYIAFNLNFNDKTVLDIGASTGGFTDFALQHGAKHVYAVDVGSGQLVDSLKNNPKVTSLEQLNFRYATKEQLNNTIFDLVTIDVSFISLKPIFANLSPFCNENTEVIALIKPQFEAGLQYVGKNGLVKTLTGRSAAITNATNEALSVGLYLVNLIESPLQGSKSGNVEYLGYFSFNSKHKNAKIDMAKIVRGN